MKAKSLLSRVLCNPGVVLAVALLGFCAHPAVFDEEAEEATVQPEETAIAETAGGAIDTSSWDELSKQVLPTVIETNLDFGALLRYARKASCMVYMVVRTPQIAMPELGSFTVPQGPPSTAQISLSWEDANDDGTIAEDEVKVETALTSDIMMKMAMDRVHKGLKSLITLSVFNILTQSTVKAERKGQGYEITVNPKKGPPVPMRLTVSSDFRITSTRTPAMDGSDVVTNLKHTKTGGKWLVTGAETTSGAGTDFTSTDKSLNEYVTKDGMPLLAKATIASTSSSAGGGVLQTQQEYSFRNWQIEKRAEPLEVAIAPIETPETPARTPTTQETPTVTPRTVVPPVEKAEAPKVRILRTEQANALAKDTILSVGNAYYDIAAAGVKAYDASFTVQLDGETVGSFKLKWEAFGGVSIEPDLADDEAQGAVEAVSQQIARMLSGGPLSDYSLAADVYAAKSAKQTVIDATAYAAAADPNVKSNLIYVSPAMRQVRTTRAMGSGETSETTYAGEEFDAKLFVRSATQTIRKPGGTPEETDYVWTYTKREGLPFVKRLEWSGTAGEETGDWTIVLENVTFEKEVARIEIDEGVRKRAELAKKVEVPHTEEARKLAQQVIQSVEKSYFSLRHSTSVAGVEASYTFRDLLGGHKATVQVNWSRLNEAAMNAGVKGDLEAEQKKTVQIMAANDLLRTIALGPLRGARGAGVYAVQSGNEYVLDASDWAKETAASYGVQLFFVSLDLRQVRMLVIFKDAVEETTFKGGKEDGRFFVNRSSVVMQQPGEDQTRLDYTWAYTAKTGKVFVKRLEVSGGLNKFFLDLEDVTFEEGGVPVVEGGDDGEVPHNAESMKCGQAVYDKLPGRYYSLGLHTDVSAFDANYMLEMDGKPIGSMNVTWDAKKSGSDMVARVFPYLIGAIEVRFKSGAGTADETTQKMVENFGKEIFSVVAERPFPFAANVYGVKSGNQTTVDVAEFYGLLNPSLKKSISYASEDLCQVRNVSSYTGGRTVEILFEGEVADGKHFVRKVTVTTSQPGEEPAKREYALTYAPQQGVVFLKTALFTVAKGGTQSVLKAEFQDVNFQRREKAPETGKAEQSTTTVEPQVTTRVPAVEEVRKLAEGVSVPHTDEAKKLAGPVVESLRRYYNAMNDGLGGFNATYALRKDGRPIGDLNVTWGILEAIVPSAKLEGEGPDDVRKAAADLGREALDVVLGIPCDSGLLTWEAPVYAVRSGDQFILDALLAVRLARREKPLEPGGKREERELKSYLAFVLEDATRVRILESYADGGTKVTALEATQSEGNYLIMSMVTTVTEPGQEPLKREYRYTHAKMQMGRAQGGAPPKSYTFVKEFRVKETKGGATANWVATLQKLSCTEFRME